MTPEQQRIKIAEACGWKTYQDAEVVRWWIPPDMAMAYHNLSYDEQKRQCKLHCPDYLNDLNAMHEAEGVLKPANQTRYYWCLAEVVNSYQLPESITFKFIHATASQRAEAFLRTLGLWEGEGE